ncbi:MAG: hypothetical protein JWP29_2873, partial [Rhodoferax sp.]|nr:hypothetical protein [Rhodoferax sp.]
MKKLKRLAALCLAGIACTCAGAAHADPISILFVGNSYTFGRVDPVMSYNAANVNDLTGPMYNNPANPNAQNGANPYEPHPWGGVAGIFKKMTDEKGLDYNVSIS